MNDTLASRLRDEADLCRNEGATDIAELLEEAIAALSKVSGREQVIEECARLRAELGAAQAACDRMQTAIQLVASGAVGDLKAASAILEAATAEDTRSLSSSPVQAMEGWRPIETAPKDGTSVLLLTADFGAVEGWWEADVANFYKSQEGWASYDPANAQGDWVSEWRIGDPDEPRLYCGCTPKYWMPLPSPPSPEAPVKGERK